MTQPKRSHTHSTRQSRRAWPKIKCKVRIWCSCSKGQIYKKVWGLRPPPTRSHSTTSQRQQWRSHWSCPMDRCCSQGCTHRRRGLSIIMAASWRRNTAWCHQQKWKNKCPEIWCMEYFHLRRRRPRRASTATPKVWPKCRRVWVGATCRRFQNHRRISWSRSRLTWLNRRGWLNQEWPGRWWDLIEA